MPLVVQDYPLIFLSRFSLVWGQGMINAKAISIISERYSGNDKTRMLGYRGSAEVVGSAILTFMVGQLYPRLASDLCRIWRWLLDFTPLYPFVPILRGKNRLA